MLYSVWNDTAQRWATSTNFSTRAEAESLRRVIVSKIVARYVVKERKFGSIGHQW